MFEIMMEEGHSFLELTDYRGVGGAQAIAFHNKAKCDVMAVEVQRGWRLTEKTLELMIFRVPRIKVSIPSKSNHSVKKTKFISKRKT